MSVIKTISDSGLRQFWSKRTASSIDISRFEETYLFKLPNDYKSFLSNLGCGSIGSTEIFGLGCPDTGIPSIVYVLKNIESQNLMLPKGFLPISIGNDGYYICLVTEEFKTYKIDNVVACKPGSSVEEASETCVLVASTFENFLLLDIQRQSMK